MNIRKILKFYFVTTLILTGLAAFSYREEFGRYVSTYSTSVLSYKYNEPKAYSKAFIPPLAAKKADLKRSYYKNNPAGLVFNISNDAAKSMVAPDTAGAEIMALNFKTLNEAQSLKNLTFKIVGANGDDIVAAHLMNDEKIISKARVSGEYINFSNIDHLIDANNSASLRVVLDLSENFKIGNRFRLDIEKPEDIDLDVNGKVFAVNGSYPMKGPYLTISRKFNSKTGFPQIPF